MRTFYAGLMILSLLLGLNLKIKVEAATGVKEVNTQSTAIQDLLPATTISVQHEKQQDALLKKETAEPVRKLPANYKTVTIEGEAKATEKQAVAFVKKNTQGTDMKFSAEEIVRYYYEESAKEGIRADLALSQALLETGFFKFNGTVKAKQNNFCGLGTVNKKVSGASFKKPIFGVRAHIQHLLAYATPRKPKTKIIDPRYELASKIRKNQGYVTTWHALNGKWAMGKDYSEKIFDIRSKMLEMSNE